MSSFVVFMSVVAAIAIGAMSPGPSFVMVSRIAVARSRRAALGAAVGMGIGGVIFATLALAGLNALLMQVGWLYLLLKLAGGIYLVHLGIRICRGADEPLPLDAPVPVLEATMGRNLWLGLATQLSNPKTAVVYGSIFAALLPASPPAGLMLSLPPAVFAVEAGWYALVALAFSASRLRTIYLGAKTWVDRLAGAVLAALGLRLMTEGLARGIGR